MSKYPQVITDEILIELSGVTDKTIKKDIRKTEIEITNLEKERDAYRLIARFNIGTPKGKMADFRQGSAELQIEQRKEFISFLAKLQDARDPELGEQNE